MLSPKVYLKTPFAMAFALTMRDAFGVLGLYLACSRRELVLFLKSTDGEAPEF